MCLRDVQGLGLDNIGPPVFSLWRCVPVPGRDYSRLPPDVSNTTETSFPSHPTGPVLCTGSRSYHGLKTSWQVFIEQLPEEILGFVAEATCPRTHKVTKHFVRLIPVNQGRFITMYCSSSLHFFWMTRWCLVDVSKASSSPQKTLARWLEVQEEEVGSTLDALSWSDCVKYLHLS